MSELALSEPRYDGPDRRSVSFDVHIPRALKYLDGHFPGRPIVPGIAQLALIERATRAAWPDLGAPAGLRRLKFSRELAPGESYVVELERTGEEVRFVIRGDAEHTRGRMLLRTGPLAEKAPG